MFKLSLITHHIFFITIVAILMSLLTISPQFVSQASLANKNNVVSLNFAYMQDACNNTTCPSHSVKTDGADSDTNFELNDYALIYLDSLNSNCAATAACVL